LGTSSGLRLIQGYGLLRAGSAQGSGRDSEIFLAFDDMGGHNFIGIRGAGNFEPTRTGMG